jgi:ABC-type Fe3+-hydroxamate transport system substrate-binding protein
MYSCTDQLGNSISFKQPPKRIVSLVPSQTELLSDLGLEEEVVGITKFCVHPAKWFRTKTRVGGTKTVKPVIISHLSPDLILANREENIKEQVAALSGHYPVWVSDISNLDDALEMITAIGLITLRQQQAESIARRITAGFSSLQPLRRQVKTAYLIWQDPFMTAGGDTFINDMLKRCGLLNIFEAEKRYPPIKLEQITAAGCELLILSSEPFPFSEKHRTALQKQLPGTKVILANGEMFSWYGSRLLQAPAYFEALLRERGW